MAKYLFGASVQGIQSFIFKTNELKEIVNRSETIDYVCKAYFTDHFGTDGEPVIQAAGNIRFLYNNRETCSKTVRDLPKAIRSLMPEVTVSQAVVEWDEISSFRDVISELEKKLRVQRNKVPQNLTLGLNGIYRSPLSGLPETTSDTSTGHSNSQELAALCRLALGLDKVQTSRLPFNVSDLASGKDWIAIIHADGNSLGQVVRVVGADIERYRLFSTRISEATRKAAVSAYNAVKDQISDTDKIPIRPVVMAGDDLTVILRADLAMDYATAFLENFEKETKTELGEILTCGGNVFVDGTDHLSACAGITYAKSSYPFYYAYQLAEKLCDKAKDDTKANIRDGEPCESCLMFHKIEDCFINSYDDIIERQLTTKKNVLLSNGPYYLRERTERWSINNLKDASISLKKDNALKNGLREWTSLLFYSPGSADQRLTRISQMTKSKSLLSKLTDSGNTRNCVAAHDVLTLISVESDNN